MQVLPPFSKKSKIIFAAVLLMAIIFGIIVALNNQKPSSPPPAPSKQKQPIRPMEGTYVPDELIVKYTLGNSPKELEEAIAKRKPWEIFNKSVNRLKELERLDEEAGVVSKEKLFQSDDEDLRGYYSLNLREGSDIAKVQELYLKHDFIENIAPNFFMYTQAVPNDEYYSELWGLKKIEMEKAWDVTTGLTDIVVAVIDTGVDYNHEDLAEPRVKKGKDFTTCAIRSMNPPNPCLQKKSPDDDPMDDNGHGTHVAGTIGALTDNNKIGIASVSWNVTILAIKSMIKDGPSDLGEVAQGIEYATNNNANVINMSLGGKVLSENGTPVKCAFVGQGYLQAAISKAISKNIVVIAAAGNDGEDALFFSPASCDGVITVGAIDQNDKRATFGQDPTGKIHSSNFGDRVDIAAPGKNILSTCLPSLGLSNYCPYQGTSQAAPHVSGVAALLLTKYPNLTPDQVRDCLVRYADPKILNEQIGPLLNAYNSLSKCSPPTPSPSPTPSPTSTQIFVPPTTGPGQSTPSPKRPTPTRTPTPTPTPIPYNCREITNPSPGEGLQLKTLECEPI